MEADIRLLEDRVRQVVQHLQKASAERSRLEGEVRDLERKLADAEKARSKGAGDSGRGPATVPPAFAEAIREAIRELREA